MKTFRQLKARIRFLLIYFLMSFSSFNYAQKGGGYYSLRDGIFLDKNGVWGTNATTSCNCVPDDDGLCIIDVPSNQVVHIRHAITSSCTIYIGANSYVVVEAGGSLALSGGADMIGDGFFQIDAGGSVSVEGDVNLGGNSTVINNGLMSIGGNLTITGSGYMCGTGILEIDGTISGGPPCSSLIVLPIELLYFNGEANKNSINLYWETASEQNNDFFEVERSADGISFSTLFEINSKAKEGNSMRNITYSAIDESPIKGIGYYRLKQVDFDGKFKYSNIISVNFFKDESIVNFYPNPSDGEVFIHFKNLDHKNGQLIIKNSFGKIVYDESIDPGSSDGNKISILNEMASGIYVCTMILNDKTYSQKIIVLPK